MFLGSQASCNELKTGMIYEDLVPMHFLFTTKKYKGITAIKKRVFDERFAITGSHL